jgi:hypothetical protein
METSTTAVGKKLLLKGYTYFRWAMFGAFGTGILPQNSPAYLLPFILVCIGIIMGVCGAVRESKSFWVIQIGSVLVVLTLILGIAIRYLWGLALPT